MTIIPLSLEASWQKVLEKEWDEPYFKSLTAFVRQERANEIPIYPPKNLVFNALNKTPYESVKIVIIGQDPYHGPGQAHGLCFSVPPGIPPPPSLKNIYKELIADVGIPPPPHGCLDSWASQGILLLNTVLTVRQGEPLSHKGHGWEKFTDAVVAALSKKETPVIFLLWGRSALEKYQHAISYGTNREQLVLKAAHPSPLSAHNGFFGCRHFSKANELLLKGGLSPIDWRVK